MLSTRPRADGRLTLEQAVAVALRKSPVVRGAVQEVEAAVRLELLDAADRGARTVALRRARFAIPS